MSVELDKNSGKLQVNRDKTTFSTKGKLKLLNCENLLRFDKVTESLKVGTFLRHSVLRVYTLEFIVGIIPSIRCQ